MKEILITILRDKNTTQASYRDATEKLASLLALEAAAALPHEKISVETPIAPVAGVRLSHDVVLVPVLRSGLALLYPFLRYFPKSRVGFIGMKRDEKTAIAHNYYINLPSITAQDRVIILEPMIATGGSGIGTLNILKERGVPEEHILYVAVIAAPEGIAKIRARYPKVHFIIAQTDQALNAEHWIVPGLGDFGDRYFGT